MSAMDSYKTAFPTGQITVLAICRICEPIAFMSIFPYAYFMVQSFGVEDQTMISMYTGMITSSFTFMECISGVFWGRLSDRVGRKKVLLGGLLGTGLSMLLFGFARTLRMALVARALGGLLNGNIGVIQTAVAELVVDERHRPRAYSIMPFVWGLGTIVGGSLGGLLASPADALPLFKSTIYETYPYLLPNLVCSCVVVFGLAVGILFLEETHPDRKYDHDRGRETGQWILCKLWMQDTDASSSDKNTSLDELTSILDVYEHNVQAYQSTGSSPTPYYAQNSTSDLLTPLLSKAIRPTPSVREAFTNRVCLTVVCYGFLAFHTISLEQLVPILLSKAEPTKADQRLPFHFKGGFGWSTQTSGAFLAMQGVLQTFTQIILFPWLSGKLGGLRTFWITLCLYPVLYVFAPYLVVLPTKLRIPGLIVLLISKVTFQSLSYPSLAMILAKSSPSKQALGTLNGVAMSAACMSRSVGPTVLGVMDSLGDTIGMSGLAWWTIAAVALLGWLPGFALKEDNNCLDLASLDGQEALVAQVA